MKRENTEKNDKFNIKNTDAFFVILTTLILILSAFISFVKFASYGQSVQVSARMYEENEIVPEFKSNNIDYTILDKIEKNSHNVYKEEITKTEEDLEYTTIYRDNKELPKGTIQVVQEGRDGKQEIITRKYFENGNIVGEKVDSNIIIAAVNKVVEIGTAGFSSNYKIKVGDKLFVTSSTLAVRVLPDKNSEKIITISQNEEVKLLEIKDNWYKIKYNSTEGYIKNDCVTYIDPNKGAQSYNTGKSKAELLATLSKSMALNKPSGFTIEQFKKVLSNNGNDNNKIFEKNAEYFYYAEKQYKVNGIFIAAVGIHESNWGTSKIALNKRNLFGYGANDNNPYVDAKSFSTYSEGIDLLARVFVKYYINAPGTSIYDGQKASGKYYSGPTLDAVNKRYATDKNWSSGVYKWMSYLYNRL